jgi:hypothetical protein
MNPAAAAAWRIKVLWKSRKREKYNNTQQHRHSLAAGPKEKAEKTVANKD